MAEPSRDGSQPIIVGRIIKAHGLLGKVRVHVLSDVPHRFDVGQALQVRGDPYVIDSATPTGPRQVILNLQGLDTVAKARGLAGEWLTVPQGSAPPLPEGEYFHFELLGLQVVTAEGESLGTLSGILETGSNDVYVVSGLGPELLIPALADVIGRVDLDQGVMVVNLPEGLR